MADLLIPRWFFASVFVKPLALSVGQGRDFAVKLVSQLRKKNNLLIIVPSIDMKSFKSKKTKI